MSKSENPRDQSKNPAEQQIMLPAVKFTPKLKMLQNTVKHNGVYFQTHQMIDEALKYFDEALDLLKTDYIPIFNSSKCHYNLAEIDTAKEEVMRALKLCRKPLITYLRHHMIDCIYNENTFEDALVYAYNTLILNQGTDNVSQCDERIFALRSILDFSIGEHSGHCLFNLRGAVANLDEKWKTINEPTKKACGVSSEPDVVRRKLKPLLKKRIERNQAMITNVYLLEMAPDDNFLTGLEKDLRLNLKQTPYTNEKIRMIVNPASERVTRWRRMLYCRQPIYSKKYNMIQNAQKAKYYKEAILNRVQLETRGEVFQQLAKVRKLAAEQKLEELVSYTISILQHYYTIKTNRIFPRIFEFRNELCNILSITFLNQIRIPHDLMTHPQFERLPYLIAAKGAHEKNEEYVFVPPKAEFGDYASFVKLHAIDTTYLTYKYRVQMLEQLIEALESPIEKCFISYEVSRLHLSQVKIDEARTAARHVVDYSEACGNYVWLYLAHLQLTRCDAIQQNLGHVKQKLQEMHNLCFNLNDYIDHFTNVAIQLNQVDIDEKEREEREKQEEENIEEKIRIEKRKLFLRKTIAQETKIDISPKDVRRHSQIEKNPRASNT